MAVMQKAFRRDGLSKEASVGSSQPAPKQAAGPWCQPSSKPPYRWPTAGPAGQESVSRRKRGRPCAPARPALPPGRRSGPLCSSSQASPAPREEEWTPVLLQPGQPCPPGGGVDPCAPPARPALPPGRRSGPLCSSSQASPAPQEEEWTPVLLQPGQPCPPGGGVDPCAPPARPALPLGRRSGPLCSSSQASPAPGEEEWTPVFLRPGQPCPPGGGVDPLCSSGQASPAPGEEEWTPVLLQPGQPCPWGGGVDPCAPPARPALPLGRRSGPLCSSGQASPAPREEEWTPCVPPARPALPP
ncbi:splicing factor 3A subunit 2-like [Perognathus longimembris pacificus]|uniref:splicing factor 3A subunit 2-like n=1 Tax=Perognathus longimembris pacificus TaxID=214514 RepID=UPI002019BDDE|nr:splicing factor 3A subunit 2-like [Perognathus longimembris pacificus]